MSGKPARQELVRSALKCILPTALVMVVATLLWSSLLRLGVSHAGKTLAVFLAGAVLVVRGLPQHHPYPSIGPANQVTIVRGALVALLAGLIGERADTGAPAVAVVTALIAVVLDGFDGWLARRTRMESGFGARFDMETDALLTLVLAVLAWQWGPAGAWVLASGLLRYAFVAAGMVVPRLRGPLPPSFRRKAIAVVQMVGLIVAIAPFAAPGLRKGIAASALLALILSFLVDAAWLLQKPLRARQWIPVLLAVLLLDAAVTFHNVWPTLAVRWTGELSVELAVLLLALSVSNATGLRTPRAVLVCLSVLVVVFGLGRYADVTAPALYGREVNLYWDVPQLAAVTGMLVRVASPWVVVGILAGTLVTLAVLYAIARWSLGRIDAVLHGHRGARLGFGLVATVLISCFLVQQTSDAVPRLPRFSIPVSSTYATQVSRFAAAFSGSAARSLPPSPLLRSSLTTLGGSDVLLVFMESYGSATYDRPEFARAVAPARERLAAAIRETQRGVVSAFVGSPTFGSGSVLAHLSLLSGIEVRDPDHYAALMMQRRATLVSFFKGAGYRAVAVMPGLRDPWPEGAVYGFNKIYDATGLDYHGPEFGWWRIPDQFSLAALDSREVQRRPRRPLFVFFPTVSTHMPFEPVPPLQSDWQRMLSSQPFDAGPLRTSLTQAPVWTDLGKAYTDSVEYFLDLLASYLRERKDDRFVLIVLGDHQPAASVSGEGASWDVPVHVIASQPEILEALQADGFLPGLAPTRPAAGRMDELAGWMLAAFGDPAATPGGVPARIAAH